jgi:hypothetical protein
MKVSEISGFLDLNIKKPFKIKSEHDLTINLIFFFSEEAT